MKHSILIVVFVISSFATYSQQLSVNDFATGPGVPSFSATVSADQQNGFILRVNNPYQKKLQVRIQHTITGVVIDTSIDSESYACRFNFDQAEDGRYIVRVKNGKERYRRTVDVSSVVNIEKRVELR